MIALICLFFPAVLGVWLYERLNKTDLCRKQWLYRFCANTVFINCICFAAKNFLLDTASEPFYTLYADATPTAALNYLIMAIPVGVIVVFLQVLSAKHTAITVEDEKDA